MRIFVYGTLKKNYGNHRLMGDSTFIGKGVTISSFYMWDVGFPYVFRSSVYPEQPFAPIEGEVYEVDEDTLQDLDWLEGYPTHYNREWVDVNVGGIIHQAQMYVTNDRYNSGPVQEVYEIEGNKKMVVGGSWVWGN